MRHLVTFDSSERDLEIWDKSTDFEQTFNTPVYNVKEISVVSAIIPLTQPTIVNANSIIPNQSGVSITLTPGRFWSDPTLFAAHIQSILSLYPSSAGTTVTYSSDTRTMTYQRSSTFGFPFKTATYQENTGPANIVMGFTGEDVVAVENPPGTWKIETGVIDLVTVRSLFLRLTHGEDDITEPVLTNPDHGMFLGRILVDPTQATLALRNGDILLKKFKMNIPTIDSLRVRIYWNNGLRFYQYDTAGTNIVIKFALHCDHVKLSAPPDAAYDPEAVDKLPEPVEYPILSEPDRMDQTNFTLYMIGAMLIIGLLAIVKTKKKPST